MSIEKSHKKLSSYLSHMGIREGLSFSDYFDDSIPADVKPPEMLCPMEEEEQIRQDAPASDAADYPTQSKDMFKGIWEERRVKSIFMESMMPDDMDTFKTHLVQLFSYLQKELQLKTVPDVKLLQDEKNANKVLGKTAYYDPGKKLIVLYTTNRHQKDVLRSFSHEVIHHWQHENGKLGENKGSAKDPQYAQKDPWMRQMEKQAYLLGNILFRDWEDKKKAQDKKSGKKMAEVQSSKIIRKTYPSSHPYRKYVEPDVPEATDIEEKTSLIGTEYPPKKRR